MTTVSMDDIAAGIRKLGVHAGDTAMVHSSLKSFGHVSDGADAVIDAFLEVIGPQGTLVMPMMGKREPGEPFDPDGTPASTGTIPETFRKRPGTIRSLHPTHSAAAFGPRAEWIARGHEKTTPMGRPGPYGKLVELDAAYVFVGTGIGPCTLFHAFEDWMQLPYLEAEFELHYVDKETGEQKVFRGKKGVAGHRDFYTKKPKVEKLLRRAALIAQTTVGDAVLMMFRARAAAEVILERLRAKPDLLLCGSTSCEYCAQARATMAAWKPTAHPAELLKVGPPLGPPSTTTKNLRGMGR